MLVRLANEVMLCMNEEKRMVVSRNNGKQENAQMLEDGDDEIISRRSGDLPPQLRSADWVRNRRADPRHCFQGPNGRRGICGGLRKLKEEIPGR